MNGLTSLYLTGVEFCSFSIARDGQVVKSQSHVKVNQALIAWSFAWFEYHHRLLEKK